MFSIQGSNMLPKKGIIYLRCPWGWSEILGGSDRIDSLTGSFTVNALDYTKELISVTD